MSQQLPRLIAIVGPTASGKSTLAARLAQLIGGEVVSADSVQVYRHFDIGSGKVTEEERAMAPHHLIDCADPRQPIEANVWAEMAREKIAEIIARDRVPVVCGGTFLWMRALLFGLAEAPAGDPEIRARHRRLVEAEGRARLHQMLREVDPVSAARLHENDFVRVSRALEVFEMTQTPLSELQAAHGFSEPRYDYTLLRVDWPLESYEERLALRVRQMIESGFREEVRSLIEQGYGQTRAMGTVGYRQVHAAVSGETERDDEQLADEIVRVTRIFARRQRTWLKKEEVVPVDPEALTHEPTLIELATQLDLPIRSSL